MAHLFDYFSFLSGFIGFAVSEPETGHRKPQRTLRRKTTEKPKEPETDDEDVVTSEQCPERFGYFADAEQCDKYYACKWVGFDVLSHQNDF